jgi:NAD(P)-dependent dehydrogenase (short-subunit alcohol dehydrogenase family)
MTQEVILVTGSNGGIGSRLVRQLLRSGHRNIACHYRSGSDDVAQVLGESGLDPARHLFRAELTDEEQVRVLRLAVEERLGPIDALLNVAGASSNGMSWKLSVADFRRVVEWNLTSAFLCSREVIPGMRERGWGRIVNFSSVVAFGGVVGASHYCAAKAGLVGLTKALALELANRNITVNVLALGYFSCGLIDDVPADMQAQIRARIPVGRFGEVEELAAVVQLLLERTSAFLTGQVLHLNGGQL